MALKNPYKLEKLTITAYQEEKRQTQVGQPFKAMFNPESFSQKYGIEYFKDRAIDSAGNQSRYARSTPSALSVKLMLDGTGCHESGANGNGQTVAQRIQHLLDITFHTNGKIHEPNYLVITWGDLKFSCRLANLDINYTAFNPDGTPLRAELSVDFVYNETAEKQLALAAKSSPDLTHSRIVKDGDTLPLLSKAIYGSSSHYLWIAQQNRLDDFRNLTPGQRLFFPPLPTE